MSAGELRRFGVGCRVSQVSPLFETWEVNIAREGAPSKLRLGGVVIHRIPLLNPPCSVPYPTGWATRPRGSRLQCLLLSAARLAASPPPLAANVRRYSVKGSEEFTI